MANKFERIKFDERLEIERLLGLNFGIGSISRAMQKPYTTIYTEIVRNGGVLNYNAQKAQQRSDFLTKSKVSISDHYNERVTTKENVDKIDIQKQIDVLKMQVQILSEAIKEMKR